MLSSVKNYYSDCLNALGEGWNRFWFTRTDPAPLGLMRSCTGLLLLWVLGTYTPADLTNFFGPDGFMPEETVSATNAGRYRPNVFSLVVDYREILLLHGISLAVVACFAAGLFTKYTKWAAFLVALNYWHRSPQLTTSLEPLLAVLMLYLCVGPSGLAYSVDAWWKSRGKETPSPLAPSWLANIAQQLVKVHLSVIYLMIGLAMLASRTWLEGMSLWWLIARTETQLIDLTWTYPLFHSEMLPLMQAWTVGTAWFMLGFGILIWNSYFRPALLVLAFPVWIILGLASGMPEYALCFLIGNLAYFPATLLRPSQGTTTEAKTASRWNRLCPPYPIPQTSQPEPTNANAHPLKPNAKAVADPIKIKM